MFLFRAISHDQPFQFDQVLGHFIFITGSCQFYNVLEDQSNKSNFKGIQKILSSSVMDDVVY